VDASRLGLTAYQVEEQLRTGEVAIYTRHYWLNQGIFSFDPRALRDDDFALIVARLTEIVQQARGQHATA
jgi:D-glucosaminate-6-phosphate ammonia-lyase